MATVLAAQVRLRLKRYGHRRLATGTAPAPTEPHAPVEPAPGRVPRVARLMALAIKFDGLVRGGVVPDYAALACLGHVSRARMTQIMNLLLLAPDIQEELLFLPLLVRGRDPVHLKQLQSIALLPDWKEQRRQWQRLSAQAPSRNPSGKPAPKPQIPWRSPRARR